MASDLLDPLIRANLAGGAVALLLLTLRGRLRPLIGPNAVYALWLTIPAAAFASLLPPRTVEVLVQASSFKGDAITATAIAAPSTPSLSGVLIAVWLAGAVAATLWVAGRQLRFLSLSGLKPARQRVVKSASDKAGPAVVGVISPRILLPADFTARFSAMQRRVILAHEGVHLARGDSRINAAVLLLQCINWFNPVAHLAARGMRLDQELSCDALVMARFPTARRSYAEAMLKSQVAAVALPIGCYWPARGPSALSRRLAMLRVSPLSRARMMVGLSLAGLLAAAAGMTAWSVQPPRELVILVPPQQPATNLPPSAINQVKTPPSLTLQRRLRPTGASKVAADPPAPATAAGNRPSMSQFFEWTAMPMSPEGEPVDVAAVYNGSTAPDGRMTGQAVSGQTTGAYRNGEYQMKSEFVRIGDKIEVSAQLSKSGSVIATGTASVIAGEVAFVALSNGQMAQLLPGQTAYIITRPVFSERRAPAPS